MDVTVEDDALEQQYTLKVDGAYAGKAAYRDVDGQRVFYHTKVDDEFGGRGLASTLAAHALGDARDRGMRIVPVCPFIAHFLTSHHDYDDALSPATPQILAALDG